MSVQEYWQWMPRGAGDKIFLRPICNLIVGVVLGHCEAVENELFLNKIKFVRRLFKLTKEISFTFDQHEVGDDYLPPVSDQCALLIVV